MVTSTSIGRGGLGRFGNQMFTIAGVIGIAIKNGHPFGFPKWMNYDNALFGGEVTDFSEFFENPLPDDRGLEYKEYGYFWGYKDVVLPEGNWSINAHLQSPKFFEHCMPVIRETFRMKDEPEQNDYVAIHYRAGDYIDDPDAYHPRQTKEYYEQAIKYFPERTAFLVFSDNTDEAKNLIGDLIIKNGGAFVTDRNDYLQAFKRMKKCKSFIIANSSYSAMAAHLGEHPEKKVIAPKNWFGKQANISAEDIYDKNWVVI